MSPSSVTLLAALLVGLAWWFLLRNRGRGAAFTQQELRDLQSRGALVLDVREPGEFSQGHAPKAANIPLGELKDRLGELDRARPILVCCASGVRSGFARRMLLKAGFTQVHNAGPWTNLR
jgi:phage shock protein E